MYSLRLEQSLAAPPGRLSAAALASTPVLTGQLAVRHAVRRLRLQRRLHEPRPQQLPPATAYLTAASAEAVYTEPPDPSVPPWAVPSTSDPTTAASQASNDELNRGRSLPAGSHDAAIAQLARQQSGSSVWNDAWPPQWRPTHVLPKD